MTQPYDSCRLYVALRDRAWTDSDSGIVDLEHDFEGPEELGLDRNEARAAVERLLSAHLVHRMSRADDDPAQRNLLFVEPIDELTATTVLMSQG